MSTKRLITALLIAATPAAAQNSNDPVAIMARIKAFPAAQSVENEAAYTPAEIVHGRSKPLKVNAASGISPEALGSAQAYADAENSFAFMVLRDGKIAYEKYAPGFTAASRFSAASMHKTVMALAFGTARIDPDTPASRWLREWKNDPRRSITVRQLLTMSGGLETPPFTPDPTGLSAQIMFGADISAAALTLKAAAPPGTVFAYSNGNSQLAGLILERATGKRYAEILSRRIWQPIGANDATLWLDRPGGSPHFFCCLQATATDWARIGQLILDKGRAGGRQVVPAAWIAEMAKPSPTNANYGLQLWRGSPYVAERRYSASSALVARAAKPYLRDDVLFMDGAVGQRVYIIPSERMVIVRIGKASMTWDDSELPNRVLAGVR
jgi:CubicO group peptidase (beta-lactamase class C family)